MDTKKIFTSKTFTHSTAALATFLLTWAFMGRNPEERFADQQDAAVYVPHASGNNSSARTLNRDYSDLSTFKSVDWANMTNHEIAQLFGETSARELAMDIDSINRKLATPGKLFGLDYNYCNKSVTTAMVEATKRMNFRNNVYAARPFAKDEGRKAALYNGDALIKYFAADSIPGTIINNPTPDDFKHISAGSVVRFPGHTKMFIGIGFVDGTGKTFVPDANGRPVIASGYNERFSYYNGGHCSVVDVAKVVEHKLIKSGRTR